MSRFTASPFDGCTHQNFSFTKSGIGRCSHCSKPVSEVEKERAALGQKTDAGKLRYDLFPHEALRAITEVLTFGAKKYEAWNWLYVSEWKARYHAALMRHIEAWRGKEWLDAESGLPHLAHALCCLVFLYVLASRENSSQKAAKKPLTKLGKVLSSKSRK